jgi:hypothetical protein
MARTQLVFWNDSANACIQVTAPKDFSPDVLASIQTTALRNGSFRHDLHYWLGKDTSQVYSQIMQSLDLAFPSGYPGYASTNNSPTYLIFTWKDEAGTAAILTVELDAALGGRAVQYREVQGNETEKLLSYFRPCIMPQPGGVASGFNHVEVNEQDHVTRLYVCRGKYVVHVKEVSYLNQCLFLF